MQFLKQKWVRLSPLFVLLIGLIFGLANMGSTLNPVPKELPLTVVSEDEGAVPPNGEEINFGTMISMKLTESRTQPETAPVKWSIADSVEAGLEQLDQQETYILAVIPATFTKQLMSLTGSEPQPPQVKVYVNQGKHFNASAFATQVSAKAFEGINQQLREQFLGQIAQNGDRLNTKQAHALVAPVQLLQEIVHPVGADTGNGNAPAQLTQMYWMASLAGALLIFFSMKPLIYRTSRQRFQGILLLSGAGAVLAIIAGFGILWMMEGILGLDVPSFWETALFLVLVYFSFYMMMSAVFHWLGSPGIPLFMLIFFFAGPILTLAPEYLPSAIRVLLLSWVPLSFSVEGPRDLFFFGEGDHIATPLIVLISVATGAFLLLSASALRAKPEQPSASGLQSD